MKLSSFLLVSFVGFIGVNTQNLPYPDTPFFIEHAHSEMVASLGVTQENDDVPIILKHENDAPDELWEWTTETYIKNKKTGFYLAVEGSSQNITVDNPIVQSRNPQKWEYYNGALKVADLSYGITLEGGSEAPNTRLVIAKLNILNKNQQFRLERLIEKQKCGETDQ
ncbi:hypothetical protein BJ944DRAFT_265086 [Cunninghamella echinulata]|nr:hypothetical protein BJ944DRAFT_265086 [Cunninghamella echinulata]